MFASYLLVIAVAANPFLTIQVIHEFKSKSECTNALNGFSDKAEVRELLWCLPLAHEAV